MGLWGAETEIPVKILPDIVAVPIFGLPVLVFRIGRPDKSLA